MIYYKKFKTFINESMDDFKKTIISKIKELEDNEVNKKALDEIEHLLDNIGAGSKIERVQGELKLINDPDVNSSLKLVSKYVLSLEGTPEQRKEMMDLWKSDEGLVYVDKLLSTGINKISDIIKNYDSNPMIKELTNDLSSYAPQGTGKCEFMLSAFSKHITKASKGDLQIKGKMIELKTKDKAPGRFSDREVKPTAEYSGLVIDFKKTFADKIGKNQTDKASISLQHLSNLYKVLDNNDKKLLTTHLEKIFSSIFPKVDSSNIKNVITLLSSGNVEKARIDYGYLSIDNYLAIKKETSAADDGVIMIDISKEPYTFIFFKDSKDIKAGGLSITSGSEYPIVRNETECYPKINIKTR